MCNALFPGGARVRPALALCVARACGDDRPLVSDALACAIEYLHCASLVHDDLPCFDDAETRRGRPSVQAAHGEAVAVLTGDALIVLAFQALADVAAEAGERLGPLLRIVSDSAGMPGGIVAGQALESEEHPALHRYHAAKTGALFEAAAAGGAAAAGADVTRWREVGAKLGAAYQIADDIHDHLGEGGALGKPTGQDRRLGRPSAVTTLGVEGAVAAIRDAIADAEAAVPDGANAEVLRALIRAQAGRFLPRHLAAALA